jgi:hypothetical protein
MFVIGTGCQLACLQIDALQLALLTTVHAACGPMRDLNTK